MSPQPIDPEPPPSPSPPTALPKLAVKRILLALDFSDASRTALGYAITLATQLQAELLLLHVFEPVTPELKVLESAFLDPSFREQAKQELARWHSRVPAELRAQALFCEAKTAYRKIVNAAAEREVDLIVIGRHGRKSLRKLVMGSTAEQVLKHAHCAVLVKAIMLQYHTDEWRNRANWGDPDAIQYGAKGTTEKVQLGELPEAGKWVRLEVEAARLGLRPGTKITGIAFTQFDGTGYWDKAGVVSLNDPAADPTLSLAAWEKAERAEGDKSSAPQDSKELLKREPEKLEESQKQRLRDYFLRSVYAGADPELVSLRAEIKSTHEKHDAIEKEIPATMISKELEKPWDSWVLIRGQYDKHGEPVGSGVPSILPPPPACEKTNRLTLARWLVDPKHPLTARVTLNRLWQQFFSTGIVKTAEDFRTRGE